MAAGESKDWTVIIIGTRWGTISFQVTKLIASAVLSLALIVSGLSALYVYDLLDRSGKSTPPRDWKEKEKLAENLRVENEKLKEKIQVLENRIITIAPKAGAEGESNIPRPYAVSIDQFRSRLDEHAFHFQFYIRVTELKANRASGYLFLVLKPEGPSSGQEAIFPSGELKDGKPADFRAGEPFSISRLKMISGVIRKINPAVFRTATIFLYSDQGFPLLEKSIDLKSPGSR
jgi:hypothetical protein